MSNILETPSETYDLLSRRQLTKIDYLQSQNKALQ